jgi:hypothetical protein
MLSSWDRRRSAERAPVWEPAVDGHLPRPAGRVEVVGPACARIGSPVSDQSAQREGGKRTDGAAALDDEIDIRPERDGAGQQVEQRERANECSHEADSQSPVIVAVLADDQDDGERGQCQGESDGPEAEEQAEC